MPTKLDYVPAILSAIVVCGALCILAVLLFHPVPTENKDLINIAFGGLLGSLTTVVAFYFGSSKSSQAKDDALQEIAKK